MAQGLVMGLGAGFVIVVSIARHKPIWLDQLIVKVAKGE